MLPSVKRNGGRGGVAMHAATIEGAPGGRRMVTSGSDSRLLMRAGSVGNRQLPGSTRLKPARSAAEVVLQPDRKLSKEKQPQPSEVTVPAVPELSEEEKKKKAAREADDSLTIRAMRLSKKHRVDFLEVKVTLRSWEQSKAETGSASFSYNDFHKFLMRVFDVQKVPEDIVQLLYSSTCKNAKGETTDFNVDAFLNWYMMNLFKTVPKLQGDATKMASEQLTTDLCEKYGLQPSDLDKVKKMFDQYDEDGSGEMERDEFECMIHQLVGAKPGDISAERLKGFWREIDRDGSGAAEFSEFVEWYLKYFGESSSGGPTEAFYASFSPQKQCRLALANQRMGGD